MIDGQRAGLTLFGQAYGWVGIIRTAGIPGICANVNGTYTNGPALTGDTILLKAALDTNSAISFAYSLDGITWTTLGRTSLVVGRTWYEGIKFGLFTYNLSTGTAGGNADFDYFHYTHDGPQPVVTSVKQQGSLLRRKASPEGGLVWRGRGMPLMTTPGHAGAQEDYYSLKGERLPAPATSAAPVKVQSLKDQ
jgi:hypothetical protein